MIRCPYCLTNVEVKRSSQYVCSNQACGQVLPRDFVEKKGVPRATVGLVGFTGHGKTCYLTALFYLLQHLKRGNVWGSDFTWINLDENTNNIMYRHVPTFQQGTLPPGTPANFPKPALIQFHKIPYVGDYFLSFYDTAGSVYESTQRITDMGRFVALSEVVLFIISIPDCGADWASRMEELLNVYIIGVYDRLKVNLKENQHLVVVLSKADSIPELPNNLRSFLNNGSYQWWRMVSSSREAWRNKVDALEETSTQIQRWLESNQCGGFTRTATERFRSVAYTIVSSTGAQPVGNTLATKLQPDDPKRVLDPFVWVLERTRPRGFMERLAGR